MKTKIPRLKFKEQVLELGFEIQNLDYFFTVNMEDVLQAPHRIEFYAIIFITNGKGVHQINFDTYSYQQNDIIFVGSLQSHTWKQYKNAQGYLILFTEKFLHRNQIKFKDLSYSYPYNSVLYKPVVSLKSKNETKTFDQLIKYLYNEFNNPISNEKQEILQCLLRTFLLKIRTHNRQNKIAANSKGRELFIRFQNLLDRKLSISRNANDYCLWLNVSFKQLNNLCKELTNKTLKAFIDSIVILRAKQYLMDGDKNISEVSSLLGFDEITNFTKYFTKHTSMSPSAFQIVK